MKAFRLQTPAPIEQNPLQAADLPQPGQGRIKVSVCGVCHTAPCRS